MLPSIFYRLIDEDANQCIMVAGGEQILWKFNIENMLWIEFNVPQNSSNPLWQLYLRYVNNEHKTLYFLRNIDKGTVDLINPQRLSLLEDSSDSSLSLSRVYYGQIFAIDGRVYIFEAKLSSPLKCYVLNEATGSLIKKVRLNSMTYIIRSEYLRERNSVLLFGAGDSGNYQFAEFDISTNQCIPWKWVMDKLQGIPLMMQSADQRYVIVIAGAPRKETKKREPADDAKARELQYTRIYDLELQKSFSWNGEFNNDLCGAVMMDSDPIYDKHLVSGFVHCSWRESGFHEMKPLPLYLIQMMAKWYRSKSVYTMNREYELGRTTVHEILKNKVDI